jgi:hypothetical protein
MSLGRAIKTLFPIKLSSKRPVSKSTILNLNRIYAPICNLVKIFLTDAQVKNVDFLLSDTRFTRRLT